MDKLARIIVGLDPHDPSMAAAHLAARIAAGAAARLEFFAPVFNTHVSLAHFPNRDSLRHARESLVRRQQERVEALAADLGFAGDFQVAASWDHPFEEALVRRVLERGADLLVVALPPGMAEGGRALSSAQWQLVRHCPVPLLLTRGRAWRQAPVIVAAIDPAERHGRGDELDVRILQAAARLAEVTGGTVHAFHAWQRSLRALLGELERPLGSGFPELALEERQRELFYGALSAAGAAPARVSLLEGRPEALLPGYCGEQGADLVVMGAIARNPFGRIFIGSTAERVLEQLPCDLLVVKPAMFRTPVARERWPREEGAVPPLGVPGI